MIRLMSRLIERCPRCKKLRHVLTVYSRSIPMNPMLVAIENHYHCTVCGLVFHKLFAKKLDQKDGVEICEELLPDEAEIMAKMAANEGQVE